MSETKKVNKRRAVAIARDVLKTLEKRNYCPRVYLRGYFKELIRDAKDLQEVVKTIEPLCEVCLLGSCLLSKAKLYDNVPLDSLEYYGYFSTVSEFTAGGDATVNHLREYFTEETLIALESYFEQRVMNHNQISNDPLLDLARGAVEEAKKIGDPKERVRRAMVNIIANKGDFVGKKVDYRDYYGDYENSSSDDPGNDYDSDEE